MIRAPPLKRKNPTVSYAVAMTPGSTTPSDLR